MISQSDDIKFMMLAIEEANKSKNEDERAHPRVGAIVVDANGTILAAAHRGEIDDGEHAEFTALERKLAETVLVGATIYTTLEPCTSRSHPKLPCAHHLLERRIHRVVIGMLDPNPTICGKGIWLLREGGVATDLFPHSLMSMVEESNRKFIRSHRSIAAEHAPGKDAPSAELAVADADSLATSSSEVVDPRTTAVEVFFHALGADDFTSAETAMSVLVVGATDAFRARILLMFLNKKYRKVGNADALRHMKQMVLEAEGDLAASFLAKIYRDNNNITDAITYYRRAFELASEEERRVAAACSLAECLESVTRGNEARKTLVSTYHQIVSEEYRSQLLVALAGLPSRQDVRRRAALLARAAQLQPGLQKPTFDAAYALSAAGIKQYALSQYASLVRADVSDTGATNNMAIECLGLKLGGMAIEYLQTSADRGNTLASSNLAYRLTQGGFYDAADKVLCSARAAKEPHENVASASVALSTARTVERKAFDEALNMAIGQQLFLGQFADALMDEASVDPSGRWTIHGKRELSLTGDVDRFVGETSPVGAPDAARVSVVVEGRGAFITLERWDFYRSAWGSPIHGLLFMSEHVAQAAQVLMFDGDTPSVESWIRTDEDIPA